MAQMLLCSNIPSILLIPPFRAKFKIVLFSNPSVFSLLLLSSKRPSSLSACQQPCGGWQRKLVCIRTVTHSTTSINLLLCIMTLRKCLHTGSSEDNYEEASSVNLLCYFLLHSRQTVSTAGWTISHVQPQSCRRATCRVAHVILAVKDGLQ